MIVIVKPVVRRRQKLRVVSSSTRRPDRAPRRQTREEDDERIYPSSDGKPMAETDDHVDLIVYAKTSLIDYFAQNDVEAYVGANNFLYYQQGNPKARTSPDTYVVFGRPQEPKRRSFFTWLEDSKGPSVVIEFTSRKTRREDFNDKMVRYEQQIGVEEYFLFNPAGRQLSLRLLGFRLNAVSRAYEPIELENDRLYSEQLQLYMVAQGREIRFYDAKEERFLPSPAELAHMRRGEAQRAEEQTQRAEEQTQRAEELERRIALLQVENARLRENI